MDQHRRALRHEAARAFLESLDKLEETLDSSSPGSGPGIASTDVQNHPAKRISHPKPPVEPAAPALDLFLEDSPFTVNDLEQAIADIEQYMQQQTAPKPEKPD